MQGNISYAKWGVSKSMDDDVFKIMKKLYGIIF